MFFILLSLILPAMAIDCPAMIARVEAEANGQAREALVASLADEIRNGSTPVAEKDWRCLIDRGAPYKLVNAAGLRLLEQVGATSDAHRIIVDQTEVPSQEVAKTVLMALRAADRGEHRYAIAFEASGAELDRRWLRPDVIVGTLLSELPGSRSAAEPALLGDRGVIRLLEDPADHEILARLDESGMDRVLLIGAKGSQPITVQWDVYETSGAGVHGDVIQFNAVFLEPTLPHLSLRQRALRPTALAGGTMILGGVAAILISNEIYDAHQEPGYSDQYYQRLQIMAWSGASLAGAGGLMLGWRLVWPR